MTEHQDSDVAANFYNLVKQLIVSKEENCLQEIKLNQDYRIFDDEHAWSTFPSWRAILEWHVKNKDTKNLLFLLFQLISKSHTLTKEEYLIEKQTIGHDKLQMNELLSTAIESAETLIYMKERFNMLQQSNEGILVDNNVIPFIKSSLEGMKKLLEPLDRIRSIIPLLENISIEELYFQDWIASVSSRLTDEIYNVISTIQLQNVELSKDIQSINITLDQLHYLYGSVNDSELSMELQLLSSLIEERQNILKQINNDLHSYKEKEHWLHKTFLKTLHVLFPEMIELISNQLFNCCVEYSKIFEIVPVLQFENMDSIYPISRMVNDIHLSYLDTIGFVDRFDSITVMLNTYKFALETQFSIPQDIQEQRAMLLKNLNEIQEEFNQCVSASKL